VPKDIPLNGLAVNHLPPCYPKQLKTCHKIPLILSFTNATKLIVNPTVPPVKNREFENILGGVDKKPAGKRN
jgi:hypothetical protein